MDDGRIARRLVVHGRVQGVFFRASTQDVAERHGVAGWAVNRPDGSVEAWLEGSPEAVAAVEEWVRGGGPPAAEVTAVEATREEPAHHLGFAVW